MLQLQRFAQHSAQMRYFLNKDILTVGSTPFSKILVERPILLFWFMFYLEVLARQKADFPQGHNWKYLKTNPIDFRNMKRCSLNLYDNMKKHMNYIKTSMKFSKNELH